MERNRLNLLPDFRHQLWKERINIKEEFQKVDCVFFALACPSLHWYQMDNLRRILPFSVVNLYVDGDLTLCLAINIYE